MPESATSNTTCLSRDPVVIFTRPPSGVNLIAFDKRLSIICASLNRICVKAFRRCHVQLEIDLLLVGRRHRRQHALAREIAEIDIVELECEHPVLHLGDEQQIADEPHEPLSIALNDCEILRVVR